MAIFKAKDPIKYENLELKNGKIYKPAKNITLEEIALILPLFSKNEFKTKIDFDEYIKEYKLTRHFINLKEEK